MIVGVLGLQGGFARHLDVFGNMGQTCTVIRYPSQLKEIGGLVIPGGESTTIGMLMERFGIMDALSSPEHRGLPILGTCAGAILLGKDIIGSSQPRLGRLDMSIARNAYGTQVDSFEADVSMNTPDSRPMRGVFIRAPQIRTIGPDVEVLARIRDTPVMVRQDRMVAATFHPELTADHRVHRYFLDLIAG